MAGLIYEFIEALETESELYLKLIEVGHIKRSHIIKGNLKELNDDNTVEGHIVSKIKGSQRKRQELMGDIAMVLTLDKETATITQIEEALANQPDEAGELRRVKEKLKNAITELRVVNDENMNLINHSIEYTEYSMNMLQSSQSAPLTANYGSKVEKSGNSLFDAKQ